MHAPIDYGSLPLIWRKFGERYDLDGNFCESCKTAFFPARMVCPNCRRKGKLVAKKMPKAGKIISFTEVFSGPAGFEHETPYFIAIIELEFAPTSDIALPKARMIAILISYLVSSIVRKKC